MALNPPISLSGLPLRVDGEFLLLERKNIEVEFNIPQFGKKTGKGKVFLSNARMVFIHEKFGDQNQAFKSFDIPLNNIKNFKFEQPIFGANYLSASVIPLYNLVPGQTECKLWFMSGGCQKFLNMFFMCMEKISQQRQNKQFQMNDQFVRNMQNMWNNNQAFVDPNDPTTMFVQQPKESYQQQINQGQYIGSNYTNINQQHIPNQQQNINSQSQQQFNYHQPQQNINYQPQQPQIMNQQQQCTYQQQQYLQQQQYQLQQQQPQIMNYQQENWQQNQQLQQPQIFNQQQIPVNNVQIQPQQNQVPQQQQQQPNVGYYFGYWGPQLQQNQHYY